MRGSELLPLTLSQAMFPQIEGLHPVVFVCQNMVEPTHIPHGMDRTRNLLAPGMGAPALLIAMHTFTEIRRGPQHLFLCLPIALIATRLGQPTA